MRSGVLYSALLIILFFLSACSGSSGSDEGVLSGESLYGPGASVGAAGFDDAYDVSVGVVDQDRGFEPINEGSSMETGTVTLAVKIEADPTDIDKVLLSDGGMYQVEALKQGDLYVCEFNLSPDQIHQGVLVQVIHGNGRATKEKVVFYTRQGIGKGGYERNGAGLLLAEDILLTQKDLLADWLDETVHAMFEDMLNRNPGLISELSYGGTNEGEPGIEITTFECIDSEALPEAIIHLCFTVKKVNMRVLSIYGQDLIDTRGNDLYVETYIDLKDTGGQGEISMVFDLLSSARLSFENEFFLRSAVERLIASNIPSIEAPPLAVDLEPLMDNPGGYMYSGLSLNGRAVDMPDLLGRLDMDLDKYLFIDLYGIPQETTGDVLSLGMGPCVEVYEDVVWGAFGSQDEQEPKDTDTETIFNDMFEDIVGTLFEDMAKEYEGVISELGYGDDDLDTTDLVINAFDIEDRPDVYTKRAHVNFTIKAVDLEAASLFGIPLICCKDNDLTIDCTMDLINSQGEDGEEMILRPYKVEDAVFSRYFVGRGVVEPLVEDRIIAMDDVYLPVDELIEDAGAGMRFAGLSSPDNLVPLFPDVIPYMSDLSWDRTLAEPYNISLAVSEDTINGMLRDIITQDLEWDVNELLKALLGEGFAGFSHEGTGDEQTVMRFSVAPVVDLSSSEIRFSAEDVIFQYRVSGFPQWEASIDLDMIIDVHAGDDSIDLYFSVIDENTHFHVMRDNPGNLGIFDHSDLVSDVINGLPEMLGGEPGDPSVSIGFDSWEPAVVMADVPSPVALWAGQGYLYLDLAAYQLDLTGIFTE